ncbi:CLUMA_CG007915, isoform A [Clunio marinus]|uniref:CLUMA_CG007915, isoform A n=1 Tax=Clunio marinus TaxID=568069 RepID=A0A1J1I262_9DIPT|nr:CLUMA_CG007915, isoform A [Clunio marinus]
MSIKFGFCDCRNPNLHIHIKFSVISETSSNEEQVEIDVISDCYRKIISLISLMLIVSGAISVNGNETITCGKVEKDRWSREFTCYIDEAIHEKERTFSGRIDLQTKSLYINKNKNVQYLPDNTSAVFPNLKRYDAEECSILEVHYFNFIGLSNLEKLDLSGNLIETLEDDVFKDLTSLGTLELSNNKIENINERSFNGLKRLKFLYLAGNKLNKLNNDTFGQLSSLTHLRLMRNSIKQIEQNSFNGLANLTLLDLTHNQLQILNHDIFVPLSSVQYLLLENNTINQIDKNAFNGLDKLNVLVLNHNQLPELTHDMFGLLSSSLHFKLLELFKNNSLQRIMKSERLRKMLLLALTT